MIKVKKYKIMIAMMKGIKKKGFSLSSSKVRNIQLENKVQLVDKELNG